MARHKSWQSDMLNFKGMRFPVDIILVCIRWYAAYPLSYRHIEELTEERGVSGDHSTVNRWAIRLLPLIEKQSRKQKRKLGTSWRMDETYIKVRGVWKYLYRAVDREGKTVDFLLTAHRDMAAAGRFFDKAMPENGTPEKIVIDRRGANKAAIDEVNGTIAVPITVRKVKYLNNIVEQDHRAIKRLTRRASSRVTVRRPCRSPTNFMRWQDKSVQFESGILFATKSELQVANATQPQFMPYQ